MEIKHFLFSFFGVILVVFAIAQLYFLVEFFMSDFLLSSYIIGRILGRVFFIVIAIYFGLKLIKEFSNFKL